MTRPLLDVRGLRVDYPGLVAVRALDLQIRAGEAVALIGPNGAGKTSTMRAICGLLEPTTGSVMIDGEDMLKQPERAKARIGFMPDFAPLYDLLTVYEFMEHYGGLYSVPNLAERIDQCLTMVELEGKRDARCKGLSRGMKQRLVLARTILPDPAVILLDEPASGLDPVSRRGFRSLVTQLRDQGKALLVSSHILSEIKEFSTHALVIEQGTVKVFGKVDDLAAQTKGARTYRTKWRTADDHAVGLLQVAEHLSDLKVVGSSAVFTWHGAEEAADELLRTLVMAGVVIREWGPVESDLEHILLAAGATTVS